MSMSYSYLERRAYIALGIFVAVWAYFIFWQFHLISNPNVYPEYASNPPYRYCIIRALQFISLLMFVAVFPFICIESVSRKKYGIFFKIFSSMSMIFICLLLFAGIFFWETTTGAGNHGMKIMNLFHNMFGYMIVIPIVTSLIFGITAYVYLKANRKRIY